MVVGELLGRLEAVRHVQPAKWEARCPAHDDHTPSLAIHINRNKILVHCHAGCAPEAVVAAIGLTMADLMPRERPVIAATCDYRGAGGELLFQVVRLAPKAFRQRRPDGNGGWVWNLNGVPRVLYRLPELLAAGPAAPVFIVEGEKDADRLAALGLIATTNAGGAGKWRAEYSEALRRRNVVILPDNDEPGREHAQAVARALHGIASRVRVVELPGLPAKADVSDWLAAGGTAEELTRLSERAQATPTERRAITVRLSEVEAERVSWLWPRRIPFEKITIIDGDPGLGKSTLALDIAARLTSGRAFPDGAECERAGVVILSAEDGLADTIRPRLDAAGADLDRVIALTGIRTAEGVEDFPSLSRNVGQIESAVRDSRAGLVIVDPLMAYIGGPEVNSYRDQDVRRVLAPLAGMAEKTRAAVLLIRHLNKRAEGRALYRGGGSIGISGAARSVLLLGRDPDEEGRLVLAGVKSNLSPAPESLGLRLEGCETGAVRIAWLGGVEVTADRLVAAAQEGDKERGARAEAADWLAYFLANGPRPAAELFREAGKAGHSQVTIRRASESLRVEKRKNGFHGGWEWALPAEDDHEVPKMITSKTRSPSRVDDHLPEAAPSGSAPNVDEWEVT